MNVRKRVSVEACSMSLVAWDGAGHDKSLLDEEERTRGEKKKHGRNPMG